MTRKNARFHQKPGWRKLFIQKMKNIPDFRVFLKNVRHFVMSVTVFCFSREEILYDRLIIIVCHSLSYSDRDDRLCQTMTGLTFKIFLGVKNECKIC